MPKVIFNERERTKATSNLEEFSSQQKSENLKSSSRQDKIKNSSNSKIILTSLMEKNKFAINSESSSRAIGFTTPLISKTFLPDFPNIGSIRFKIELKNIIDNLDEEAEAFNDHKKIELIILLSEPSHSYAGTVVKKVKINSIGTENHDISWLNAIFLNKNNQYIQQEDKINTHEPHSELFNFKFEYYNELKTIDNFFEHINKKLSDFPEEKFALKSLMDWNISPKSSKKIEELNRNEEKIIEFWMSYRKYYAPPALAKTRYQIFKYDSIFIEFWLISGKKHLKSLKLSDTVDQAHKNLNNMFYKNFYEKIASIKQYNWIKYAVNSIILLWIEVLKHYKILHNVTKSHSDCSWKSEVLRKTFKTKGRVNLQYITSLINKEIITAWLTHYCRHSFKFLENKEIDGSSIYFKDFLDDCYLIDFIEQNFSP
ncbi:hypothetical protein PPACK8108_LOCUS6068 [Phakopsora pachyrhizi]|uniref:Uncharacterized protein n=1 Tax=Phakopsora pachyrhizi TaxID=170000 RepID=A0AAV0ATI9_PHAPC|nr:hypothetical protein PPACK8108_LOCUS6068 [Phakopsora pachyrhizi]